MVSLIDCICYKLSFLLDRVSGVLQVAAIALRCLISEAWRQSESDPGAARDVSNLARARCVISRLLASVPEWSIYDFACLAA